MEFFASADKANNVNRAQHDADFIDAIRAFVERLAARPGDAGFRRKIFQSFPRSRRTTMRAPLALLPNPPSCFRSTPPSTG